MSDYESLSPLPSWTGTEQLQQHPELDELLKLPFDQLLTTAALQLDVVDSESTKASFESAEDPRGELSLFSATMTYAQNEYAVEKIRIQVGKRSISAVYETSYKGLVGKIITPDPKWAISHDTGSYFYWNEAIHGDTPTLFALAGTDCEEVALEDVEIDLMRQYISVSLYSTLYPDYLNKFIVSDIARPDLQAQLGLH